MRAAHLARYKCPAAYEKGCYKRQRLIELVYCAIRMNLDPTLAKSICLHQAVKRVMGGCSRDGKGAFGKKRAERDADMAQEGWDQQWQRMPNPNSHSWALKPAHIAHTDPSSPIGQARVLHGVREKISPYPKVTCNYLLIFLLIHYGLAVSVQIRNCLSLHLPELSSSFFSCYVHCI